MPKILLVGDLHLRDKRLRDIAGAWRRAVTFAEKNDVDLIAQAGDVFDHVNVYGKSEVVGTIYDAFISPYKGQERPVRTLLIPGNHDIGGASDKDALAPLDSLPWVTVARCPEVLDIDPALSVCTMPWLSRSNLVARLTQRGVPAKEARTKVENAMADMLHELRAKIEDKKKEGRFVLFLGHLEVTGASLTGGQVQANGFFEFSPLALSSLGAHAYGLAHIHIRQRIPGLPGENDGYLGTICQLSFGEEGNETGCRLVETDGAVIKSDRWLNNSASPRYVTIGSLDDPYQKDDYVRLKCDAKPESMPEGMIFVRACGEDAPATRTEKVLDCDTSLDELIGEWAASSKCEVPIGDLVKAGKEMEASAPKAGDAVGSLEWIRRVRLENVTCHKLIDVDMGGIGGICGIEGPNGSGKTTLVEAILVAPFGISPSRPSLATLASQDAKDDSIIEVDFVSTGKEYRVRREFKGGGKSLLHKAYLYDAEGNVLNGPKVDEVSAACEGLIGDPAMVLAGVFSSQGESGNIIELRPAERKELFAKLLGTHKFLALADLAKNKASGVAASLDVQRSRASQLKGELLSEEDDKLSVDRLRKAAAEIRGKQESVAEEVDAARQEMAKVNAARQARKDAEQALASLKEDLGRTMDEGMRIKKQRDELAAFTCAFSDEEVAEARAAKNAITERILRKAEADSKWATLSREAARLRGDAARAREERSSAWSKKVVEDAGRIDELAADRARARRVVAEAEADIKTSLATATARLESARKQAGLLGGFPDEDVCKTCPLASESIKARDDVPEAKESVRRLAEKLGKVRDQLAELDEETARLTSRARPEMPDDWMPELAGKAAQIEKDASDAERKAEEHRQVTDDVSDLDAKAARLPEMELAQAKVSQRKFSLAKIDAKLDEKRARFRELEAKVSGFKLPNVPDDMAIQALASDLAAQAKALAAKLSETEMTLGAAEAVVAAHRRRRVELVAIEADLAGHAKKAEILAALSRAFGRDGIPQLIVEGALPRFQEVMAGLLDEFDGRWIIKVNSQKLTKAGTTQEVIDILVDAGDGPRDIGTFSGGEKKIMRTVVRVAFSTLQAERSGRGLKVLVLDEATDSMDDDNSETIVRMLGRLSSFNQIFVVSHNTRMLSSVPSRITLSADGSIRTVAPPPPKTLGDTR